MKLSGFSKRLVDEKLLSEEEARRVQTQAIREGKPLTTFLIEHSGLGSRDVMHVASSEFGIPVMDLSAFDLDQEVIKLVDEKLIHQFEALPLLKRGNKLFVAVADPANLQALDQFQFHTGIPTSLILVDAIQLRKSIVDALESTSAAIAALTDTNLDGLEFAGLEKDGSTTQLSTDSDVDDAPLVRYVNKILLDAINKGASDIHFEPFEQQYRVRFRIDGILQEMATPPATISNRLSSRIKVMARLDISERRLPQDGRIKLKLSRNRAIDFRVSTCPTMFGEKIVLRILDSGGLKLGVDALGFSPAQKELFLNAIYKPYGMVLVTGPTGSGKTVTLYNALHILNTSDRNISSVEDPAEIYLQGINQVNINPKIGLTFASVLRSFLRQDPDVIMVGEIRDAETAEIAMKAAQTGHMVLSTLHTNDAPHTLTRLLNIGVQPYNIISSVNLIIAQRLIRKLCEYCKIPHELSREALLTEGFAEKDIGQFIPYKSVGCDHCTNGYKDREGIFQVMPISETMEKIIMNGGNATEIEIQAKNEHIPDLRASGLQKIAAGVTSLEEINRVTME